MQGIGADCQRTNPQVAIESKLRSFQVKLNFRAIVTNKQLHGFDLIENGTCAFCKTETEILMHLFCTCTIVQCYWEDVNSWLNAFLARPIVLTDFKKSVFLSIKISLCC